MWKALKRFFSRKKKNKPAVLPLRKHFKDGRRQVFEMEDTDLEAAAPSAAGKRHVFVMNEIPREPTRKENKNPIPVHNYNHNTSTVRKTCTYCQHKIAEHEKFYLCPACGSALHRNCMENKNITACMVCKQQTKET